MNTEKTPVFETERLYATRWHVDLAEQALEIYSDPLVYELIPGMRCESITEMTDKLHWIIERNKKWQEPLGGFPVFLKSSNRLVGAALIKNLPDGDEQLTDEIEIGWHLGSPHWGQGFATEFGNELIRIGFDLGLPVLYAVTGLENSASRAVCERLGMQYMGRTQKYYGEDLDLFEIRKPE